MDYYLLGYLLLFIGMIIMMIAQATVSSNYSKYLKMPSSRGYTGQMVARKILDENGLQNVRIEMVQGKLADHYDPKNQVVRLSAAIHNSTTIAAIAVSAHECGHALQHAEGYKPLLVRSSMIPVVNFSQSIGWIVLMIGLLFGSFGLSSLGIIMLSAILIFQLITLPVEFDASSRAIRILENGFISSDESMGVKKMLNAAAMTYVAAVISTFLSLARIILMVLASQRQK